MTKTTNTITILLICIHTANSLASNLLGSALLGKSYLETLCYASSLSYLPTGAIHTSPYIRLRPDLVPLAQVVEPSTESGATIFSDKSANGIIVACRGSATPRNFLTNLRFSLVPIKPELGEVDARVHEGFQEAATGLWELLAPILEKMTRSSGLDSTNRIVFTGHSLGAGTAELCALYAASSSLNFDVDKLVTFGGPNIGDKEFSRYVNEEALSNTEIYHIVHDADPILANNQVLWDKMGFKRSGTTLKCDPYSLNLLEEELSSNSGSLQPPAWNILDHCKYLGIYVGPRLIL